MGTLVWKVSQILCFSRFPPPPQINNGRPLTIERFVDLVSTCSNCLGNHSTSFYACFSWTYYDLQLPCMGFCKEIGVDQNFSQIHRVALYLPMWGEFVGSPQNIIFPVWIPTGKMPFCGLPTICSHIGR